MKKYKTYSFNINIEKAEIERETKHFVVLENGRRDAKFSDYCRYYDTFNEAKDYLIKRTE
jgi:hypothetical protein